MRVLLIVQRGVGAANRGQENFLRRREAWLRAKYPTDEATLDATISSTLLSSP